ncbi:MAG: 16S rRNA (guanine(966)-N(2))-methyltransferase RsmD [Bacillota bacterium]|jgi:16S rRNA (guanine966-N2)-methyltransferase
MRVISGIAGGRRLTTISGRSIRPTSDRVREAIFNIIAERIGGSVVLDLFAGIGSLGIEALSRGARYCVFVDNDRAAREVINKNLNDLGFRDLSAVVGADALRAIGARRGPVAERAPYDLIFADPPYALDVFDKLLLLIKNAGILAGNGLVIVEHSSRDAAPSESSWMTRVRQERYGDTQVSFYMYLSEG